MKQRLALAKFFARGIALAQECQRLIAEAKESAEKAKEKAEAAQRKADEMYENMSEEAAMRAEMEGRETAADRAQERADALSEEESDAFDFVSSLEDFYNDFYPALEALAAPLKDETDVVTMAQEWMKLPNEPRDAKKVQLQVLDRVYEPKVGGYVLALRMVLDSLPKGIRVALAWNEEKGAWLKTSKCDGEHWPWLGGRMHSWFQKEEGQMVIASLYKGEMDEYFYELPPSKRKVKAASEKE